MIITKDLYAVCPKCSACVYKTGVLSNACNNVGTPECVFNSHQAVYENKVFVFTLNDGDLAMVSDRWRKHVMCYAWSKHRDGYAYAKTDSGKNTYLHRFVHALLHGPNNQLVDHANGNRLDCTDGNLRLATHAENRQNTKKVRGTSKYIGVYYNAKRKKWVASIQHEGSNKHIGYYDVELDAAKAYNERAKLHYGEFAKLNEEL